MDFIQSQSDDEVMMGSEELETEPLKEEEESEDVFDDQEDDDGFDVKPGTTPDDDETA